jgi:hypothetical protein
MKKENIIRKLTSRKLWVAVAGFVSGLIIAMDGSGSCNMRFFKKELAPYSESRADPSYIVFN